MKRVLGSCCGLGFLPVAPGTWASAAVAAGVLALSHFWPAAPASVWAWLLPLLLAAAFAAASVYLGAFAAAACGAPERTAAKVRGSRVDAARPGLKPQAASLSPDNRDPRWFVLDECAGQALALAGLQPAEVIAQVMLAVVLFRVLDIMKPWPIKRLETLSGGWGITADDLAAGLAALVLRLLAMHVCIRWLY